MWIPPALDPINPAKHVYLGVPPALCEMEKVDLQKVPEFPQYDNKLHLGGGVVLISKGSGKEYMPKRKIKWTNTYRRVCKEFIGLGHLD